MDALYNKTSLIMNMEPVSGTSLLFGSNVISALKVGLNDIVKAYLGSTQVFPAGNNPNGLLGKKYVGYHGDNPSWFDTATISQTATGVTALNNFSSSPDNASEDYYSWQWLGYFKPSTSEEYTFYLSSDDGSYLWIGNNAVSGYTTSNALVNNGGAHGSVEVAGSIALVANTYYPIRIQFGEIGGGDIITVSFSSNTISKTTNGNGYYYNRIY